MSANRAYAGLDYFKLAAAILVIAVHTSPLLSLHAEADFILTRIIARVAVPFFFMATGFFLLPRYMEQSGRWADGMHSFMKKTLLIYCAAILLYLPVNVYAGYIQEGLLFGELVQDLLFDGTFYHLWYLPASMLGAAIVWAIMRYSGKPSLLLGITCLLYMIGLFGDSYYGLIQGNEAVSAFYNGLFGVADYTRNGLFFAPVYLAMGALIGYQNGQGRPVRIKLNVIGFLAALALLLGEGLLLHSYSLQRHDSMYIMLLPCMYFLFQILICWRGPVSIVVRKMSMLIYILHPLVIIGVRGLAKLTSLQTLLIENSLMHFIAVTIASLVISALLAMRYKNRPRRNGAATNRRLTAPGSAGNTGRAWAEINLEHLRHNVASLQRILPASCQLMAVVKANAYGHGDELIASELNRIGVRAFAVATLSEGVQLRQYGIKGDILILSHTQPQDIAAVRKHKLIQTVGDYDYAQMLNARGIPIKVHIKVDTGMHRLGESYKNIEAIAAIYRMEQLTVEGIYTHLSRSDSNTDEDITFTRLQIQHFDDAVEKLRTIVGHVGKTHVQSSYGVLNYPELQYDYARVGIAMYGLLSKGSDHTRINGGLLPVLALKARVSMIKKVAEGETVGYGSNGAVRGGGMIAVVSIGYADGVPRSLSGGNGNVLLNGRFAPIVGNVCMDQLMIDITSLPHVAIGDVVTLIGQEGDTEITAAEIADRNGSITNDLMSRLGSRLVRLG